MILEELKYNGARYYDETAYKALTNIMRGKNMEKQIELKRGDIAIIESNGKRSYCVIVSNNTINHNSDSVLSVAITMKPDVDISQTHVDIMLSSPSVVICEHIWNTWKAQIQSVVRECTYDEMKAIDKAIRISVGLDEPKIKASSVIHTENLTDTTITDEEYREMKEYIEKVESENKVLRDINRKLKLSNTETPSAIEAERNLYKSLYEKLLDKLIGA